MMRLLLFCVAVAFVFTSAAFAADAAYKALPEIPIGGEGGWDILTIDAAARRLYLAHSTKVEVVDINAGKVVGEIKDTPGVHAFQAVPEAGVGFSSNGKENKVSVVDLKTLATKSKLDVGESPDAMAFDQKRGELYVFNHRGNSVSVIDVKSAKVTATIPLDGTPEFAVADEANGRVYCNIEDKSAVAVIDSTQHKVVANWPLSPGEEPSGIAFDAAHHRLFATCRKLLVMLDTDSGKVIATVPTANGADGCAFDPATQLVFASCGEGIATIAKEDAPDRLSVVQSLPTGRGARTIALDPATHRIFLPTAQFQPAPSPSPGMSPGRPGIVPNTLTLLVYGPSQGEAR